MSRLVSINHLENLRSDEARRRCSSTTAWNRFAPAAARSVICRDICWPSGIRDTSSASCSSLCIQNEVKPSQCEDKSSQRSKAWGKDDWVERCAPVPAVDGPASGSGSVGRRDFGCCGIPGAGCGCPVDRGVRCVPCPPICGGTGRGSAWVLAALVLCWAVGCAGIGGGFGSGPILGSREGLTPKSPRTGPGAELEILPGRLPGTSESPAEGWNGASPPVRSATSRRILCSSLLCLSAIIVLGVFMPARPGLPVALLPGSSMGGGC